MPIDDRLLTHDFIGKSNISALINHQASAAHVSHNLAMAVECDVTGAVNTTFESSKNKNVMATHGDVSDRALFLYGDITSGFDAAIPVVVNDVILKADVCAAGGAKCRAGLCWRLVLMIAL